MKVVPDESFLNKLDEFYPLLNEEDLKSYASSFKNELTAALSNQRSSLPTILNPIAKMTPKSGFGVAVAVGGTNGYVSAFYLKDTSEIKFMSRQIFTIPKKTTQTDLFHLITKNILFVTKNRKEPFPIGIGLAYPLKPLLTGNFIDGELLYMTKDRIIEGLVGKRVGQEYHKFLKKEYGIDTTVAVANDAICLLLGGGKVEIAGVVGTGLNFAYWDRRSQVAPLKLSQLAGFVQNEVAVNIESKNFDKIKGTKYRDVLDKASSDPGYSLSEKEVAGAYLYKLFNSARKDLIKEKFPDLESTDELNDILTHAFPYPKSLSKVSKTNIRLLANRIFHKSAQIVAIQLCGICQKIGKTEGLVPVVMEGGIFWKAKNYPALVNLYVNMILPKTLPSFARLFGSSRRGIAILAKTIY